MSPPADVVSNDQARTQTPSSMLKTYTSPRPQIAKTWGADVWILPPPPTRCVADVCSHQVGV